MDASWRLTSHASQSARRPCCHGLYNYIVVQLVLNERVLPGFHRWSSSIAADENCTRSLMSRGRIPLWLNYLVLLYGHDCFSCCETKRLAEVWLIELHGRCCGLVFFVRHSRRHYTWSWPARQFQLWFSIARCGTVGVLHLSRYIYTAAMKLTRSNKQFK